MRSTAVASIALASTALFALIAGPAQAASPASQSCEAAAQAGIAGEACATGYAGGGLEWTGLVETLSSISIVTVSDSALHHKRGDPFTLKWNKIPFKKTGETRIVTVENLGAKGKVSALNVVSNPVNAFVVTEAQEEACRKKEYEEVGMAESTCEMTVKYEKKSANCQPVFKMTIKVTPGEGESEIILNG